MKFKSFRDLALEKLGERVVAEIEKDGYEEVSILKQIHPQPLMNQAQAARFLEVHPLTIKKWALKGKLPFIQHPINGRKLYRKEVLEKLFKDIK